MTGPKRVPHFIAALFGGGCTPSSRNAAKQTIIVARSVGCELGDEELVLVRRSDEPGSGFISQRGARESYERSSDREWRFSSITDLGRVDRNAYSLCQFSGLRVFSRQNLPTG